MLRTHRVLLIAVVIVLALPAATPAQNNAQAGAAAAAAAAPAQGNTPAGQLTAFDQVVERIVARETALVEDMKKYTPLVEVYIQAQGPVDKSTTGSRDYYFLGRSELSSGVMYTEMTEKGEEASKANRSLFRRIFSFGRGGGSSGPKENVSYHPNGFLEMIYIDRSMFSRTTYNFEYLRREFLGEVRTLVFDISPKAGMETGRFRGRIWVEDQGFNVVRFNGAYQGATKQNLYFHFDSWRQNVVADRWIPSVIYSEESNLTNEKKKEAPKVNVKAQVRLWGYNLSKSNREAEFSQMLIEADNPVRDASENSPDRSPVEAKRLWDRQAEDNVVERLQTAALLAPPSDVDKVLDTVLNNLIVTNNLNIEPEVRARVLLTSTLEAFPLGHTLVLSRGLIDVLPDEPSLAAVLAQQLAHILTGHDVEGKYAFNDRMIVPDAEVIRKMNFRRTDQEMSEANNKAMELLRKSPYKDQLQKAGLFFATLAQESKDLPQLIQANLGNGVVAPQELLAQAPALDPDKLDQITALPLGSRVKLDPWTSRVELVRGKPVALISPKEKMPFEIAPFMLYLTRYRDGGQPAKPEGSATEKADQLARKPAPQEKK